MDNVTGSENRGPLSELETEAEAEEEEPGAAALEDPEEQPTSIPTLGGLSCLGNHRYC